MAEKFIMLNLDDEKISKVSEVLGSKACKKILEVLIEENLSESDLAKKLDMPLNTVEYNLKKLIHVGLVEKTKEFFWSKKGKKIPIYRAARKSIIIQPKSKTLKSIITTGIASIIIGAGIRIYYGINSAGRKVSEAAADLAVASPEFAAERSAEIQTIFSSPGVPAELWFVAGSLVALFFIILFNWRKL